MSNATVLTELQRYQWLSDEMEKIDAEAAAHVFDTNSFYYPIAWLNKLLTRTAADDVVIAAESSMIVNVMMPNGVDFIAPRAWCVEARDVGGSGWVDATCDVEISGVRQMQMALPISECGPRIIRDMPCAPSCAFMVFSLKQAMTIRIASKMPTQIAVRVVVWGDPLSRLQPPR